MYALKHKIWLFHNQWDQNQYHMAQSLNYGIKFEIMQNLLH